MTPLAALVQSRTDLVGRLGWTNTVKGLRHVDTYLATALPMSPLLSGLPIALGLDPSEIDAAAVSTRQQIADAKDEAARARSRSSIEVLIHRDDERRRSLVIQAWLHGRKLLDVPGGFDRMTLAQQVRAAAQAVRRHHRNCAGVLPAWGRIVGYRLQATFDHAVVLNTDGTVREGFDRNGPPPAPELRVKGRRMPLTPFA